MSTVLEDDRSKTAERIRAIRMLARQVGCEQVVRQALEHLDDLHGPATRIALVGAPNAGKSNLINALIGRKVLAVAALPSQQAFVLEGMEGTAPEHFVAGGAVKPLADLQSLAGANAPVRILLHVPWLAERRLSLMEKPALDASDEGLPEMIETILKDVDVVVLAMDSQMPVRRSETLLLGECERRNLPVIVALTKADRLTAEERRSIGEYVTKQIQAYTLASPVIEIAITAADAQGVERLKESIDDVLAGTDFASVRLRQTTEALLGALHIISGAAEAALQAQKQTDKERAEDMSRRQIALNQQAAVWAQIEQKLQERRQEIDAQVRQSLVSKEASIAESLLHDLEGRSDIKAWWQSELPYRLQRELRAVADAVSGSVNRKIAGDLRWLQEELALRFRLPQAAVMVDANVTLDGGDVRQKELPLWGTNKLRIVSRVGQAAAVLMAGKLLLTAGLGGATMGISILAGLAAEQAIVYATSKDREKVRGQLEDVISKAALEYAIDVSRKLKAGYGEIIEALKIQQRRWQEAQIEALKSMNAKGAAGGPGWQGVADQAKALEQEMRQQIASAARI